MKNIMETIRNREVKRIFDAVIIGLTLLDVILLTGTLFVQVSPETYYIIVLFDLMPDFAI